MRTQILLARLWPLIDQIAPIQEIRVKNNSQDWFDVEIHEEIETWDKLLAYLKSLERALIMKITKKHATKYRTWSMIKENFCGQKTEWEYWKTQRTLEVIEIFGSTLQKSFTVNDLSWKRWNIIIWFQN